MDILGLVEIGHDAEFPAVGAYVGHGNVRGFLHDVAERTGQLDFAGAVHDEDFHLEHIAADFGIGEAVGHADEVLIGDRVVNELAFAEEFRDFGNVHGHALEFFFHENTRGLAAECADLTFEIADAGFAGVAGDDFFECRVGDFQRAAGETVPLELLRKEVIFRNRQLFLGSVGVQFDDFHTVDQRTRNGVEGVCGRNEHTVGEVNGEFDEVVAEILVLLAVENFEEGGCRVAVNVGAHLVHFVEEHDRVHGAALGQRVDDASGHGSNVGLPVTADVGFVADTAERYADILPLHRTCDRGSKRGLADSGRADKAENLVLQIGIELLDREVFDDAFLDFFQTVVIGIEDFLRRVDIVAVFRFLVPRNFKAGVEIIPDDRRFGRAGRGLAELENFLLELFLYFLRELGGGNFLGIFVGIFVNTEFGFDGVELFAEVVVSLIVVHGFLDLAVDFQLGLEQLHLVFHDDECLFRAEHGIVHFQHFHLVLIADENAGRDEVREQPGILDGSSRGEEFVGNSGEIVEHFVERVQRFGEKGFRADIRNGIVGGHGLGENVRNEIILFAAQSGERTAAHPFRNNADIAVGLLEGLLDLGDTADVVEIGFFRRFDVQFLLGQEKDVQVGCLCRFARGFGEIAFEFKIYRNGGESDQTAKGNHGQGQLFDLFDISGHNKSFRGYSG